MGRERGCLGHADGGRIIGVHHRCAGATAAKKAGSTRRAASTSSSRGVAAGASSTRGFAAGTSSSRGFAAHTAAAHCHTQSPGHANRAHHPADPPDRADPGHRDSQGDDRDTPYDSARPAGSDAGRTEPDGAQTRSPRPARDARQSSATGTQRASGREAEIPGRDRQQQILPDRQRREIHVLGRAQETLRPARRARRGPSRLVVLVS